MNKLVQGVKTAAQTVAFINDIASPYRASSADKHIGSFAYFYMFTYFKYFQSPTFVIQLFVADGLESSLKR